MNFGIHTAKLDRELLRAIAKKEIVMSKTAINLIFHLLPYVDHDGRIHLDKELVKKQMYCERRSFRRALDELCEITYRGKKLLTFENGYYVSSFHVSTKGADSYLKHLPIFTSPEFLELTLNQTRLFLYVATLNVWNQDTKVAIENLYKNTLHNDKFGMPVYHSYQDMVEDLFYLIDNGFVSARLPGETSEIDKNNSNYKELFNQMCGFVNNKKKRTSKYKKNNHVIGLKVATETFQQKAISNKASETEIRLLAEKHHMFHEDMKQDTFHMFTGKKKSLMQQFDEAGLNIYRASLEKYFAEKHENIVYYDLKNKAVNYFVDFYLLEEIKKVILSALKFETKKIRGEEFTSKYSFKEGHIYGLVNLFIADSSEEHKVLIDQDIQLIQEAHEVMSSRTAKAPWTDLSDSITAAFVKHTYTVKGMFEEECKKNGIDNADILFEKIDEKELIVSLASNSLLSQQKKADEEAQKLKQIVRFFRKKRIPLRMNAKLLEKQEQERREQQNKQRTHKSNFDWLEQR
ncbi:hypothetical protein [Halalkalibacter flavus]|uniref:hypothetical protein n=1 Tax=Halalkalibacter flavus TaxID=3090668 RepID=UPI002FC8BCB9